MAYMSQEKKKRIAENLKVALKNTGLTYTLGVHNHSTIVMRISKGPVDFIGNYLETLAQKPEYERARVGTLTGSRMTYMRVNDYHYDSQFTGKALDLLKTIIPILHMGNHNRSDIQSDYFDVGFYVDVSIGSFDKPYIVTRSTQ